MWPHLVCSFQWVLAFEIFIPLVLFFILLGLRQKKPTISVKEGEKAGTVGTRRAGEVWVPCPPCSSPGVLLAPHMVLAASPEW